MNNELLFFQILAQTYVQIPRFFVQEVFLNYFLKNRFNKPQIFDEK